MNAPPEKDQSIPVEVMEHAVVAAATGRDSILVTTDSIEELTDEITTTGLTTKNPNSISEIQETIRPNVVAGASGMHMSDSFCSDKSKELSGSAGELLDLVQPECADDYLHDPEWLGKKKHVFILSTAGKPIYSLHGNEDKLATLFGVMQALVSVVQSNEDIIHSIQAGGVTFVFLVKSPLILVAASKMGLSVQQIQLQLNDAYNQILSILTLSHMTKIYEKRKNFDLRRLLAGSERLLDHLLLQDTTVSNKSFTFLTQSVRILPLATSIRDSVTSAIQSNCSKIKNLVFAVLIAKNKLIALVRMKKYSIHPADLRLIFNLIECSESFKTAESWTPICLPKFDPNGFLHAHVSYLADDCQACLLLLSVERDVFFTLSDAKKKIVEKLRKTNCLESINEALTKQGIKLKAIGIPEIRHFLYKSKSSAQLLCSEIGVPYETREKFERLESLYFNIHHRIHNTNRPLKLIFDQLETEVMLAWATNDYELYATFEPTVDKNTTITLVQRLLHWIDKEASSVFILNAPTF